MQSLPSMTGSSIRDTTSGTRSVSSAYRRARPEPATLPVPVEILARAIPSNATVGLTLWFSRIRKPLASKRSTAARAGAAHEPALNPSKEASRTSHPGTDTNAARPTVPSPGAPAQPEVPRPSQTADATAASPHRPKGCFASRSPSAARHQQSATARSRYHSHPARSPPDTPNPAAKPRIQPAGRSFQKPYCHSHRQEPATRSPDDTIHRHP